MQRFSPPDSNGRLPEAVGEKTDPRVSIITGAGCFIPLGLFTILVIPGVGARGGFPLLFVGFFLLLLGGIKNYTRKKNSLPCPFCERKIYNARQWRKPVCPYCLKDIPRQ